VIEELRQQPDGEEHGPDGHVLVVLPQPGDGGAVEAGALDDRVDAVAGKLRGDGLHGREDRLGVAGKPGDDAGRRGVAGEFPCGV
jgi:hypothetical protein